MVIVSDKTGTVDEFNKAVVDVLKNEAVKGLLILACDSNEFTSANIDKHLRNINVPIFGGIFPQIISGNEKLERGTIVAGLSQIPHVHIIQNLSDAAIEYEKILDEQIPDIDKPKTMFVFVDGFSKRISSLIDSLFNVFGLEFNYIGGGAGSLNMRQKPCIITNNGLLMDVAVLALLNIESGIGVCHGWKEISGPFKVTESDRTEIRSLDWKPAFEVYRDVVERHSKKTICKDNFFDIAKCYPFGISRLCTEKIVRDPFIVGKGNSLVCVGEVPEEAFVHILTGDASSLVKASGKALALGKEAFYEKAAVKTILFMDCISRVLFLGDNFKNELNAVYDSTIPLIGALTIGEIANSGKDYLEFYNKTSVVGVMGD